MINQIDLEDFGPDLMCAYCNDRDIPTGMYAIVDGIIIDKVFSVNWFHKTITLFNDYYQKTTYEVDNLSLRLSHDDSVVIQWG